jgi:predicted ester cyclase
MSESPNKQVYRRFVEEVINEGDISVIDELFNPDYVDHTAPPGAPSGLSVHDQVAGIPRLFRGAFPDLRFTIESMVEQDGWVGTRVTGEGTHTGAPFMGLPPSGRKAVWSSFGMFRIQDGRIAEHYGQPDMLGLREQLEGKTAEGQDTSGGAPSGRG